MLNNGVGGCGNDLALDDIVFKSCGDTIAVEDTANMNLVNVCENEVPYTTTLTATPDFTIFSSHFYQWQASVDRVNWTDIPGETTNSYTTPLINNAAFYRVKVAESVVNVNNDSCNSSSEIYEVRIIPLPNAPASNGDLLICENDTTPLSVTVPNGVIVNWYDASTGGNLLLANSNPTFFNIEGGQYTIYVKHQDCDQVFTAQHIHFYIPEFFTPNNDAVNDTFNLKGIEFFSASQVEQRSCGVILVSFC